RRVGRLRKTARASTFWSRSAAETHSCGCTAASRPEVGQSDGIRGCGTRSATFSLSHCLQPTTVVGDPGECVRISLEGHLAPADEIVTHTFPAASPNPPTPLRTQPTLRVT